MKKSNKTKQAHISTQLLAVLIPLLAIAVFVIYFILSLQAKKIIQNEASHGLQEETMANAADSSQNVDSSANAVSDSSTRIDEIINIFKV